MPLFVNDTSFIIDGSRSTVVSASPVILNGMIVRVFNTGSTAQDYTYTDISNAQTTVSVPASGSLGNPVYVLASSASAVDSFNNTTGIVAIRLLITGSSVGNSFTEQLITTAGAGSWTKPAGVTEVIVECWGAGGAGGGATDNPAAGAGGGGGQYSRKLALYSSAQQNISYTIATGGTGGTGLGGNGGDTTWNTTEVIAKGGTGGGANANTPLTFAEGGLGDIAGSVGDVIYFGANGAAGLIQSIGGTPLAGAGGGAAGSSRASTTGGQGSPEYGGNGGDFIDNVGSDGNPGFVYGGAGSGGCATTNTNRSGGNGAQGLIRLIYR